MTIPSRFRTKEEIEAETAEDQKTSGPARGAREGGEGGERAAVPDYDGLCDEALRLGLEAMAYTWDNKAQKHVVLGPDVRARLDAAKLYLSYRHGMPLARQLVIEGTFKDRETELIEAARTPSGREVLLKIGVIDAEWLTRNRAALEG